MKSYVRMNSQVLITGGAGFIGSQLVDELFLQGYSVRVIDNFPRGNMNNIRHVLGEIEIIERDIRVYYTVLKAVKNDDIIVHKAVLSCIPRSVYDPITTSVTINLRSKI